MVIFVFPSSSSSSFSRSYHVLILMFPMIVFLLLLLLLLPFSQMPNCVFFVSRPRQKAGKHNLDEKEKKEKRARDITDRI